MMKRDLFFHATTRQEQKGKCKWLRFLMPNVKIFGNIYILTQLERGMATHSSILAWRIQWTEEPSRPRSIGWQRVRHYWSNLAHTHKYLSKFCMQEPKLKNISVFKPETFSSSERSMLLLFKKKKLLI